MPPDPRETGFGAPDDLGGYDAGFGSPDDVGSTTDTGFGSPSYLTGVTLPAAAAVVPDDGGTIVELVGTFTTYPGPYVVTLFDGPDATDHVCYGAVMGQGYTCWADVARTRLPFVTPPLEVGTYSVRVVGEGGETEELVAALTVVRRLWYSEVFALRGMWPADSMPTGAQDLRDEALLDSSGPVAAIDEAFRAAFVKAVGEELTDLAGIRMARLTTALAPAAVSMAVESVIDLPDAGVVYVEGLDEPRIAYTGRTLSPAALTGLTRDALEQQTAPLGAVVTDWSREYSSVEEVRADLLLGAATGTAVDEIAQNEYGVARGGSWMLTETYRDVALARAYMACGPWTAVFDICDAWTQQWRTEATSDITGAVVTSAAFTANHAGRWLRVGTALHRIDSVVVGVSATLRPNNGPYWTGASYAAGARAWSILPFVVERRPGLVEVRVALPTNLVPTPTYVPDIAAADYAAVVVPDVTGLEYPPGSPYAGHVLDPDDAGPNSDEDADIDPAVPFYLGGGGLQRLLELLEDVIAEGCIVTVASMPV